jgi:hypothetical protein
MKPLCLLETQTSKIDIQLKGLTNDPCCYFYEFCLLILMLAYTHAKNLVPKRDPKAMVAAFMEKVLRVGKDSKYIDLTIHSETEFGENLVKLFGDCFSSSRSLKKQYDNVEKSNLNESNCSSQLEVNKEAEQNRLELVNSIRVKSILSKSPIDQLIPRVSTKYSIKVHS